MEFDERGREILNPEPVSVTVDRKPLSMHERVRRMVRYELSQRARENGMETFDEANDFDTDEDSFDSPEPETRYQQVVEEYVEAAPSGEGESEDVTPAPVVDSSEEESGSAPEKSLA